MGKTPRAMSFPHHDHRVVVPLAQSQVVLPVTGVDLLQQALDGLADALGVQREAHLLHLAGVVRILRVPELEFQVLDGDQQRKLSVNEAASSQNRQNVS